MAVSFKDMVRGGYSISATKEDIVLDSRLKANPSLEKVVSFVTAIRAKYIEAVTKAKSAGAPVEQLRFKREAEKELGALTENVEAVKILNEFVSVTKKPRVPKVKVKKVKETKAAKAESVNMDSVKAGDIAEL